jgi:hypothetical protein
MVMNVDPRGPGARAGSRLARAACSTVLEQGRVFVQEPLSLLPRLGEDLPPNGAALHRRGNPDARGGRDEGSIRL